MKAALAAAFLAAAMLCAASGAVAEDALALERMIPLANVSGRIDHMAVDLGRGRLFVAELGNDTVDVVDIASGKVVHRLTGLRSPQGIGYAPKTDIVAVANAGDGSVHLYRGRDLAASSTVQLGDDADNIRVDRNSGRFIVGYGGGGLAAIEPATGDVVWRTPLPAHPESFRMNASGTLAFVNLPNARQVAVMDLTTQKPVGTWRLPGLSSNFPMAFDAAAKRVAVVFRSPALLTLLDPASGAISEQADTCGDSDDVFFDEQRHRIYVTCGSGDLDVFDAAPGQLRLLKRIATDVGARTSLFVPELDRLFVARRARLLGSNATILVFRPAG